MSSDESQNLPASAAALRRATRYYIATRTDLPQTVVTFRRYGDVRVSHGLCQGCTTGPSMQSLTLAASADFASVPLVAATGARVLTRGAHDDIFVAGMTDAPASLFRVPVSTCGGSYNPAKSISIGRLARHLVKNGSAASSAPFAAVFGSPVGDVSTWASTVWLPRFRRVIESIHRIADVALSVAVSAAAASGGPGSFARHWLRTTAACSQTVLVLRRADDMWIDLWAALAGSKPPRGSSREALRDRIFGRGASSLGHSSAEWIAPFEYAAGLRLAPATISQRPRRRIRHPAQGQAQAQAQAQGIMP